MRYLLPAVAVGAALAVGTGTSLATQAARPRHAARVASHVSLHLGRHNLLSGRAVAVKGRMRPTGRHRVKLVFRGADTDVVNARTGRGGAFVLRWRAPRSGSYGVRAYVVHERRMSAAASVPRHLTAYRQAVASYYGPGLYGAGVACGGTLEPGTLGVASKTLPCGTEVRFLYHGRRIRVPVIDRGPYVAGRDFDLTAATKAQLGFPAVGTLLSSR